MVPPATEVIPSWEEMTAELSLFCPGGSNNSWNPHVCRRKTATAMLRSNKFNALYRRGYSSILNKCINTTQLAHRNTQAAAPQTCCD